MSEHMLESAQELSYSTVRRTVRLGSYTYLPAPPHTDPARGILMKGGLPVTLEVTEEILQNFMDAMSALERDLSRRWTGAGTRFSDSPAE
ncbi:hypothetical protein [Streptomyces sp. NPDC006193]|uniref:hypothetical protein n=1 Tax=Streptomyces sp. NPDC006193 TaxID=3155717 RepID=UPI0033A4EFD9